MIYVYDILEKYKPFEKKKINFDKIQVMQQILQNEALVFMLKKIELPNLEYCLFLKFLDDLNDRYDKSLIQSGTNVGVICAQSIGESLTQMTLNSFHNTGTKKAGLTGISRLTELLDASQTPKVIFFSNIKTSKNMLEKTYESYFNFSGLKKNEDDEIAPFFKNKKEEVFIKINKKMTLNQKKYLLYQTKQKKYKGIAGCIEVEKNCLFLKPKQKVKVNLIDFFNIDTKIDLTKIECNDIQFILSNFGIEAARQKILNELKEVLSNEGIDIDIRHLSLLVDYMSFAGEIKATRYGSISIDDSPILKATFQQGTTSFALAASNKSNDKLNSISSQILVGKLIQCGTNFCKILENNEGQMNDMDVDEKEEYNPVFPDIDIKYCQDGNIVNNSPRSYYEPMNSPKNIIEPDFFNL